MKSWTLIRSLFSIGLIGATLALGGSVGAAAATTTDRVPFDAVLDNACNGDSVALSGTGHIVDVTPTGGSSHFDLHLTLVDVHGVGLPSGETYILNGQFIIIDSGNPNGVFVSQAVISSHLISNGPADNHMVMMTSHITQDPQGNIISFHSSVTEVCTG